jgi:hypothetical protein
MLVYCATVANAARARPSVRNTGEAELGAVLALVGLDPSIDPLDLTGVPVMASGIGRESGQGV